MPAGTKLPKEVIERTRELAAAGLSAREIGEAMGVAKGTILNRCRTYGIELLHKPRGRQPQTAKTKPKPRPKRQGFSFKENLTPEELEERRAASRYENARTKATEEALAKAAEGALHLPLLSFTQHPAAILPSWGKQHYFGHYYEVTALGRTQCRFPMTDGPPHTFCGKACRPGSRYCPAHHDICVDGTARLPVKLLEKALGK